MASPSSSSAPYLSVVAASRNDDHGGDPLRRTQIFINCFAQQCEKHRLPAELILVDWNPVPDRPGLAAVLQLPPESSFCTARVITVPAALHRRFKYAENLPFLQMIAKNAGIRRARGQFVLATNIDIIFSNELMQFISQQTLDPLKTYRVDRHDIQAGLSLALSLEATLEYAWSHPIRQHRRLGPPPLLKHLYGDLTHRRNIVADPGICRQAGGFIAENEGGTWHLTANRTAPMAHLHTNACGDFKLISKEGWDEIRGYPEFAAYSFNVDSMGLVAAHYAGFVEVTLLPPCVCFHIEHSLGSGWTPEGAAKLFARLRRSGVLSPEWPVLMPLVEKMRREQRALEFNHGGWGLADFDLPEEPLGRPNPPTVEFLDRLATYAARHSVGAVEPAYDLDRLALAMEFRTQKETDVSSEDEMVDHIMQVFVPDESGGYHEGTSVFYRGSLKRMTTVVFQLESFPHQFPLRLDPVAATGVVEISSITLLDTKQAQVVFRIDGTNASALTIGGTAQLIRPDRPLSSLSPSAPIYLLSTGDDPQLGMPPLADLPTFPLLLIVELRLFPL